MLAKAATLRENYTVTVLPQAKKLGKQFGALENQALPPWPLRTTTT